MTVHTLDLRVVDQDVAQAKVTWFCPTHTDYPDNNCVCCCSGLKLNGVENEGWETCSRGIILFDHCVVKLTDLDGWAQNAFEVETLSSIAPADSHHFPALIAHSIDDDRSVIVVERIEGEWYDEWGEDRAEEFFEEATGIADRYNVADMDVENFFVVGGEQGYPVLFDCGVPTSKWKWRV